MSDDGADPLFDRSALLHGLPARRATTLLFAIEVRTAKRVAAARSALATFENEQSSADREHAFLQAIAGGRDLPVRIRVQDLERYAAAWADFVPPDPGLRAALLHRLAEKYPLSPGVTPRILDAVGALDPPVAAAYERSRGTPVEAAFRDPTARERIRWWRAGVGERLETLPPMWMAFALALTETIGEGILAIPVAVAGVGPLAGIALLIVLGLVNLVTLAALVEAITRTGEMRYGETYFGRFVREYLGLGSSALFTVALFVFNAVVTLVYFLGFASVLGDATGIGLGWWVALLFAINVAFVRKGTVDATVASALVIGAINIGLIFAICGIGLAHLDPDNLVGPGGGSLVLDIGILQLVFGVVLVAYFGHTSAGNAAKLILRDDMTGRSLLAGNALAMVVVIALYSLSVLAINGAVGAEALASTTATAITPLADVTGPSVLVLGSIYVVLALGIGSIYGSLGMFNQVREWLPSRTSEGRQAGRLRRWVAGQRGRLLVSLVPVIGLFVVLEGLILAGAENFTEPLGSIGVLAVPLLGGVFPMLLVVAARRRGELLPRPVVGVVGHPVVAIGVGTVFVVAVALHGLVIWEQPWLRVAALAIAGLLVGVAIEAVVSRRFQARTVIELVADRGSAATVGVVAAGRAVAATIRWAGRGGAGEVVAASTSVGPAAMLDRIEVQLPPGTPPRLRVWVHAVDNDDASSTWPASITIGRDQPTAGPDDRGMADIAVPAGAGGSIEVVITARNGNPASR